MAEKDFYVATEGASIQTPCPPLKLTAGKGSTSADDCKSDNPGTYYNYNGHGAPGTKGKSPHKCDDGKN